MKTKYKVFDFILAYKTTFDGLSPSYQEIMDGCNLSSKSVVAYNLDRLEEDGRIKRRGTRGITVPGGRWRLT